jgi:putative oxidoreductase
MALNMHFSEQCVRNRAGSAAQLIALTGLSSDAPVGVAQHPDAQRSHIMFDRLSAYAPQALAVLRIVTALLFILHGTQKIIGFPASDMTPPLFSLFGLAGFIEIVAGILVLIGFFTRPAAFIAAGEMAVAYWMAHAPANLFPAMNGGDAAILFCFIFLYLVFSGPGAWSLNKQ